MGIDVMWRLGRLHARAGALLLLVVACSGADSRRKASPQTEAGADAGSDPGAGGAPRGGAGGALAQGGNGGAGGASLPDASGAGGSDASGCSDSATTLATGQPNPTDVLVDTGFVYWLNSGRPRSQAGSLMRAPVAGGGPEVLAGAQEALSEFLTFDGAQFYWHAGVTVRVWPGADGGAADLWQSFSSQVTAMSWAAGKLYLGRVGFDIFELDPLNATTRTVYSSLATPLNHMLADGGFVYLFVANATGPWDLVRIPVAGGAPEPFGTGASAPGELASDATDFYWAGEADGTIQALPKAGGSARVIASGQASPRRVAVDATHAYWTNFGSNPSSGRDGAIMRAPKAGGPAEVVACAQFWPVAIALDATRVYFTSVGDDAVRWVAK